MDNDITKFIISFVGGLLWYRVLFSIVPIYFERPLTRTVLRLRWHHLHWGVVLISVGIVLFLLFGKSTAVIVLFGIGLGFIIDLFIPSLVLETDREKELVVYRNSLIPTLLLGFAIIVIVILLSFLF
ncbi:MAG: hypothetical protein AAB527_01210 [Patescibacteria group bacterium]